MDGELGEGLVGSNGKIFASRAGEDGRREASHDNTNREDTSDANG